MSRRVVIVGGGLAGLAAAVGLADADVAVTLLESRPRLGGRAGSFFDNDSGEWIDTCQHVAMGCCTNLAHFARIVGIEDLFATQEELVFIGPDGQRCRFRDQPFPAPLHLLGAFLGLSYFSRRDRMRLCLDVARLAHRRWSVDTGLSFDDWLAKHSRTAHLRERFWDVILVSALSETADRIAVPHARKVFVDGFLANRDGWRVQIPTVPLDELYGRRLIDWLTQRGVAVRMLAGVGRLKEFAHGSDSTPADQSSRGATGSVESVELRTGEVIEADEFIVAVPWHRAADLVPSSVAELESFAGVKRLESAPISSVHLWFDRPVIDVPHAVLVGRSSQWVFRRGGGGGSLRNASGRSDNEPVFQFSDFKSQSEYLQVVISASRNIAGWEKASVIDDVMRDLATVWPQIKGAKLLSSRVVTEHRAVFSPVPGVESLRPDQQSPIENLQLAGDWTITGWPATMEGAVKSGFLAAENVLRRMGTPRALVQSGLEPGWLARMLLRL